MKFRIFETPIGWSRAGINKAGRLFNTQHLRQITHRINIQRELENNNKEQLICGPIKLNIDFFMPRPNSSQYKLKKYPLGYPDLDNLIKYIMDTMQSIVYQNDRVVCEIHARKMYSRIPRLKCTIEELDFSNLSPEELDDLDVDEGW